MALRAKEVASLLNISQATLSLVVNNKPGISDQTRQKVLKQLKEGGFEYLLNDELTEIMEEEQAAEAKEDNNVGTIGFVTFKLHGKLLGENSFFPLIISGIESRAREFNYTLSYITVDEKTMNEDIQYITKAGCEGFVLFATEMKEKHLQPFVRLGIPFVIFDNIFYNQKNVTVKVNNTQGTFLAVWHLINKGHKKIGYIRSGIDIYSFNERYQDAVAAIKLLGGENPEKYTFEAGYPMEEAYLGMKEILKGNPELPTAFLADNDLNAVGAMKAVKEAGYRVPEDISFIGFDDRPICVMTEPELTTIALPRYSFGAEAVEALIRNMKGKYETPVNIEINGELIERKSVENLTGR